MLDLFGPEVWITSLALSCAAGWLIGDRSRVFHDRRARSGGECGAAGGDFFTLTIRNPVQCAEDPSPVLSRAEPSLPDDHRGDIFADMPPLAELRASTDKIRQQSSVWDAPDLGDQIDALIRALDDSSRGPGGRAA